MLSLRHLMQLIWPVFTVYAISGFHPYAVANEDDSNWADRAGESKRIEVYSLSQNYWDTQYGDTLGDIVLHLLPNNPSKHAALKQDIVHLNPHAFINADPSQLLAKRRLWLPGYMKQADSRADPKNTTVESFSWGNVKRRKE